MKKLSSLKILAANLRQAIDRVKAEKYNSSSEDYERKIELLKNILDRLEHNIVK